LLTTSAASLKKKLAFFLIILSFNHPLFANDFVKSIRSKLDLYVNMSGGYGVLQDAANKTGESGLFRFGLGSMWRINNKLKFGSELGFQTGSQMVLTSQSTAVLGQNALPVFLIMKAPADALLTMKYIFRDPFYLQVKGGYVYQGTMVNGADVITTNRWLPDVQGGAGIKLSDHCRFAIHYQRFFGEDTSLKNMNARGVSTLVGIPTWQAILLSVEINV